MLPNVSPERGREVRDLGRVFLGGVKIQEMGLHPGALEGKTEDIRHGNRGGRKERGR